jgi:hypothetical protein
VCPSLAHLLVLSESQDVKFELLVKSRIDQVKAAMTYSMKSENKLDGASNFRAWKTMIDLILAKNKVLDIVKGKIVKPEFEEGKEKEPQNIAAIEKFKDDDINAMSIIVDSIPLMKALWIPCHEYHSGFQPPYESVVLNA